MMLCPFTQQACCGEQCAWWMRAERGCAMREIAWALKSLNNVLSSAAIMYPDKRMEVKS
jgi:hypothetical protein